MSRFEDKIKELGYKNFNNCYIKNVNGVNIWVEPWDEKFSKIHKMFVFDHIQYIKQQNHLDMLQQAFNEMQKDLAILKEVEQEGEDEDDVLE